MNSGKHIQLVFIFLGLPWILIAQPSNPGNGPISGIIYLLLAAVGLGVANLRKKKK